MLLTRRFLPYFVTQCLGALNDNIYKNILLLMVTYSQVESLPIGVNLFVNLAAGVFILPFFLFSAHAGLLADNMDKARLIRNLKLLEMFIMSCATIAILSQSYLVMLLLLFLMGSQSAYFGPVKYSLLPQALFEDELVKGNAWVETGTFLAILLGTLMAGLLIANRDGAVVAAALVWLLSFLGYVASRYIPSLPAQGLVRKLPWKPFWGTWRTIKQVRTKPSIWMAIVAISWFWFLGATYLTQFPNFAKLHLHADASVVSLLLALFSIGIAMGSLLSSRLSCGHVELGLLPFGLMGLAFFGLDLVWAVPSAVASPESIYGIVSFISEPQHYHLMFALLMIGASGGLFIVPLYAFIQARSQRGECAQAIAANNIVNALSMVCSALLAMALLEALGWSILQLFILLALLNLLVGLFLYYKVAEFRLRFVSYLLRHSLFKLTISGEEKLPKLEAGILVCQFMGYLSPLFVLATSSRKIRFVLRRSQLNPSLLRLLFSETDLIVVDDTAENESSLESAYQQIHQALANNELVCLFTDEAITEERPQINVERLLANGPVAVIPMLLCQASAQRAVKTGRQSRNLRTKIVLSIDDALIDQAIDDDIVQAKISTLLQQH
ncbi:MFS transporter [Shewanella sp. Isolate11]|uniref:MFS transporter n=1 Tax=Shewanella sp. Isolate11 TaxID=2908530 RepID=UPI001EFCA6F8|nr:MFS transporter [Shewanella sp. Isolate11]MCG9698034.1 MFS transporter [Shewanella sp. Isolate11]